MKKPQARATPGSRKKKRGTSKRGCDDCGYPAVYLHDTCPMCEPCPGCKKPLMECECKESE